MDTVSLSLGLLKMARRQRAGDTLEKPRDLGREGGSQGQWGTG